MTSEYNHYNKSYEERFIKAQTQDFIQPKREIYPLPNPIYTRPIQYFDSPVKNSNQYPNMYEIKAVDYSYRPPNIGDMIDKSIELNKRYVIGGTILTNRQYNYKS